MKLSGEQLERALRVCAPRETFERVGVLTDPPGLSALCPGLTLYDLATHEPIARIEPHEATRVALLGSGKDFSELIRSKLSGWRERLYDYNPVADGLFEGDTL